ncbi:MAG: tetratricopeptide repeat protein [Ekhidna sp.]
MKLFKELNRRNVIKAAITYLVVAWLILQVISIVFPMFNIGTGVMRYFFIALAIGFPVWVIFAYLYEWTPTGFKKTKEVAPEVSVHKQTGKRLNGMIIGGLVVVVLLLISDRIFNFTGISDIPNPDKSIAVLPFENMSGDEDAYFASGVTEDILTHISKIGDLRVLSRFTLKEYDTKGKSVEEIGKELGVGYLLTGSIRKAGEDLRISCQLVQVNPEEQTWAENFDKRMEDVFAIQNEVATEVAKYLRAQLTKEEEKQLNRKPTESLEAYNLYLRGLSRYQQEKPEQNELAIKLFKAALEIDPSFTIARVHLLSAYSKSITQYGLRSYTLYDSMLEASKQLVKADPESSEALSNLSYNYLIKGDFNKAIDLSEKAIRLNPNDSKSINTLGLLLRNQGKIDQAIPLFKKVKELNPLRLQVYNYNLGTCYELLGMYDMANTYFNSTMELSPNDLINIDRLAHISLVTGQYDQTEKYINQLLKEGSLKALDMACEFSLNAKFPMGKVKMVLNKLVDYPKYSYLDNYRGTMALAYVLKKENQLDSLNRVLNQFYEAYSTKWGLDHEDGDVLIPYAQIAALRDDKDEALRWVKKMVNTGSIWTYELMRSDVILEEVRKDPRYNQIMEPITKKRDRLRMSVSAQDDYVKL